MNDRTLVFLADEQNVLLAMKKKGFGAGKWNGYGGKVEPGETIVGAAVRELREESEISIEQKELLALGVMHFVFLEKHEWDQDVHIFLLESMKEAKETEEMKPEIFSKQKIPFSDMWEGDDKWIPLILEKQKIEATLEFTGEGNFSRIIFEKPFKKIIEKK